MDVVQRSVSVQTPRPGEVSDDFVLTCRALTVPEAPPRSPSHSQLTMWRAHAQPQAVTLTGFKATEETGRK